MQIAAEYERGKEDMETNNCLEQPCVEQSSMYSK